VKPYVSPTPDISRVTSIKILGITITNHLSIGEHVRDVIGKCAQSLYALKLLRNHGMSDGSLRHVYKAFVSCCMLLQPGGDSPAQPINNVSRHQYGVLYGLACTRPMILRFLNWSQIWTTTYLHTFGTILITFCTNFYLTKLITRIISDHVHILSH